jgi:hypothetical protein
VILTAVVGQKQLVHAALRTLQVCVIVEERIEVALIACLVPGISDTSDKDMIIVTKNTKNILCSVDRAAISI